jgi:hypothetical protein
MTLVTAALLIPLSFAPAPTARAPLLCRQLPSLVRAGPVQATLSPLVLLAENDGESTRPVRDLIENNVALAYLGVLAILVGFLGYLAIADQQAKQRARERAQRMEEDMQSVMATTQSLRAQGKEEEAQVLEREMRRIKRAESRAEKDEAKAKEPAIRGLPEEGNRFGRRQREKMLPDDDEAPKKKSRARARSSRRRR